MCTLSKRSSLEWSAWALKGREAVWKVSLCQAESGSWGLAIQRSRSCFIWPNVAVKFLVQYFELASAAAATRVCLWRDVWWLWLTSSQARTSEDPRTPKVRHTYTLTYSHMFVYVWIYTPLTAFYRFDTWPAGFSVSARTNLCMCLIHMWYTVCVVSSL